MNKAFLKNKQLTSEWIYERKRGTKITDKKMGKCKKRNVNIRIIRKMKQKGKKEGNFF